MFDENNKSILKIIEERVTNKIRSEKNYLPYLKNLYEVSPETLSDLEMDVLVKYYGYTPIHFIFSSNNSFSAPINDTTRDMKWNNFIDLIRINEFELGYENFFQYINCDGERRYEKEVIFYHELKRLLLYANSYEGTVDFGQLVGYMRSNNTGEILGFDRDIRNKNMGIFKYIELLEKNNTLGIEWSDFPGNISLWFINAGDIQSYETANGRYSMSYASDEYAKRKIFKSKVAVREIARID